MKLLLMLAMACAQEGEAPDKPALEKPSKKADKSDWKLTWTARGDIAYDSNVFQLDKDQQDRLKEGKPGDEISGRFDDMESVDDVVFAPSIRFNAKGPSPLGRKLEINAEFEWLEYVESIKRSHFEGEVSFAQGVGPDGRLTLSIEAVPQYFRKNYLVDANDFSGDVTASEKVFAAGEYREFETELEYRHEIAEKTDVTLNAFAALGIRDRTYGGSLAGRDEFAPSFALGLRTGVLKRAKGFIRLKFEAVDSPTKSEVLLLDETFFGMDFNGDLDATDANARAEQLVNRSRMETSLTIGAEIEIGESVTAGLEYERRWEEYASDEPFDVAHRDRSDVRDRIEIFVRARISESWEGRFAVEHTIEKTDRPADPDSDESSDYRRTTATVSVIFRW